MSATNMGSKPGFDSSNADQSKRIVKQQEQVNRSVLSKQVRVISIPNSEGMSPKELAKKFLNDIVMYTNKADINAIGWIKSAGTNDGTSSFREEISSSFWDFFLEKGKKNLMDYNRKNNTSIKLIRGQTVQVSDIENLSLYLRRRIRLYCTEKKLRAPEININNGYLTLKGLGNNTQLKIKSTELAIRLGWSYENWNGAPIKEMLTETEKKNYQDGRLVWGSTSIESLMSSGVEDGGHQERKSRKRGNDPENKNSQKMPRCEEEAQ